MDFIYAIDLIGCSTSTLSKTECVQNNLGWFFGLLAGLGMLLYTAFACYVSYINDRFNPESSGHYHISNFGNNNISLTPVGMVVYCLVLSVLSAFAGIVLGVLVVMFSLMLFAKFPVISSSVIAACIIIPTIAKVHRLAIRTNKVVEGHINDKTVHRSN